VGRGGGVRRGWMRGGGRGGWGWVVIDSERRGGGVIRY